MLNKFSTEQLVKYFSGVSLPKEKRTILLWANESEENQKALEELRETWIITGNIPDDFNPDVSNAWSVVSKRIEKIENVETKSKGIKKFQYYLVRIAAVFVIGFAIYFMSELNNNPIQNFDKQIITTVAKQNILLPDGSSVWLNENSSLKYSKSFEGSERVVVLNGEAYFEVTKNPNKPFIVQTHNSKVRVLGTSFNYKAFDNNTSNVLTVNSGKVLFAATNNKNEKVVLVKGEKAELVIENNSITKTKNIDKNYLAWKTGKLIFENDKFENIVKVLSNHYKKNIKIETNALKSTKLTVTFDNKSLEEILNIIDLTLSVTHSKKSKENIIY
ncbi:MAG: FecR family protein [Melioribacteraceae bacterium]